MTHTLITLTWNTRSYRQVSDSFETKRNLIRLALTEWLDQVRLPTKLRPEHKKWTTHNHLAYV